MNPPDSDAPRSIFSPGRWLEFGVSALGTLGLTASLVTTPSFFLNQPAFYIALLGLVGLVLFSLLAPKLKPCRAKARS